jgi:hypothetical protein
MEPSLCMFHYFLYALHEQLITVEKNISNYRNYKLQGILRRSYTLQHFSDIMS